MNIASPSWTLLAADAQPPRFASLFDPPPIVGTRIPAVSILSLSHLASYADAGSRPGSRPQENTVSGLSPPSSVNRSRRRNLADMPSDVLYIIEDHLRAITGSTCSGLLRKHCHCSLQIGKRGIYQYADPALALSHSCRDIKLALEDRTRTFWIPYCRIGLLQSAEGSSVYRQGVT